MKLLLMVTCAAASASAQAPATLPAVRQIGRLERVTTDSLASVASAIAFADGSVLVNDRVARRVVLYDSSLSHATTVADTTPATANAYGQRPANVIRYRGDSALLIDQSSLSMFVIGPRGAVARVMAIPRADDAQAIVINAASDARGRLVYFNALGSLPGILMLGRGDLILKDQATRFTQKTDSAFLLRVDPGTRVTDTIATLRIPKLDRELKLDGQGALTSIVNVPDPLPVVDEWVMLSDGAIAVVRGRDYHVDVLSVDGAWTTSPRMAFDWQRVDDGRKQALIDSTVAYWQASYDRVMGGGGGRGGPNLAPLVAVAPPLTSVSDYVPPIAWGMHPLSADAEGHAWVRTTNNVGGRPVYDVVDRRLGVIDRVQLPAFRTIAGFGPGVIYMAVKDASGAVHLERARIR